MIALGHSPGDYAAAIRFFADWNGFVDALDAPARRGYSDVNIAAILGHNTDRALSTIWKG